MKGISSSQDKSRNWTDAKSTEKGGGTRGRSACWIGWRNQVNLYWWW